MITPDPLLLGLLLPLKLPRPSVVVKLFRSWTLAFLAPAPPMLVPSSLTPPRLPKGDGWPPVNGVVVDKGDMMGFDGTRDMLVGDDVWGRAPGMVDPPFSMSSLATRSASEEAPLPFLVGETGSAMVTETMGVIPRLDDMVSLIYLVEVIRTRMQ